MFIVRMLLPIFCLVGVSLYGQEAPPPAEFQSDQGFTQTLVMIAIALAFFYLILWRPEQKRRQQMESQREALKKGDRVLAMGIIGVVSRITDDTVIVKMVDGNKVEFVKSAISEVLTASNDSKEKDEGSSKRVALHKDQEQ